MPVSLLFTRNKGLVSRLVCFFTRSDFSHVDIYDPKTDTLIGAMPPVGVREVSMKEVLHDSNKAVLVTMENIPDTKIVKYARSKVGAAYDWPAIFGFAFRRRVDDPARYFCSELIAKSFAIAGYPMVNEEHHSKQTPDDIYGMEGFGKVKIRRESISCQ